MHAPTTTTLTPRHPFWATGAPPADLFATCALSTGTLTAHWTHEATLPSFATTTTGPADPGVLYFDTAASYHDAAANRTITVVPRWRTWVLMALDLVPSAGEQAVPLLTLHRIVSSRPLACGPLRRHCPKTPKRAYVLADGREVVDREVGCGREVAMVTVVNGTGFAVEVGEGVELRGLEGRGWDSGVE